MTKPRTLCLAFAFTPQSCLLISPPRCPFSACPKPRHPYRKASVYTGFPLTLPRLELLGCFALPSGPSRVSNRILSWWLLGLFPFLVAWWQLTICMSLCHPSSKIAFERANRMGFTCADREPRRREKGKILKHLLREIWPLKAILTTYSRPMKGTWSARAVNLNLVIFPPTWFSLLFVMFCLIANICFKSQLNKLSDDSKTVEICAAIF